MNKYFSIMCKKVLFLIFTSLFSIICNAQIELEWAKMIAGNSEGRVVDLDNAGNIYTMGIFTGTVDFDPSSNIYNLTSPGGYKDIYILKVDSDGNFVWAKKWGGAIDDEAFSMFIDKDRNIYVTGYFQGTVDFDPSSGVFNLSATSGKDLFIFKLDSLGNFLWAKKMGESGANTGVQRGKSIVVDEAGNIITVGDFVSTTDFDPGSGIYSLSSANLSMDVFVSKLDSDGNFIWAKSFSGANEDVATCVKLDRSGNIYISGYFSPNVDFDPGPGSYIVPTAGSFDAFIVKLDSNGNFNWVKTIGGSGADYANAIALDSIGNIYVTGNFQGTADFDPGPSTFNLTSMGNLDIFILKLDSFGDFVWAKNMGGNNFDEGKSITVDLDGSVYTVGLFYDVSDFNPDLGTYNLTSLGISDAFILKLDSFGNFIWAKSIGGGGHDLINFISLDIYGNSYITGKFSYTVDFDFGLGTYNLVSTGSIINAFVAKFYGKGIYGNIFNDINADCILDNEVGLINRRAIIQPGNIIVETNSVGIWQLDSLPDGLYTITIDSNSKWQPTCGISQIFTVFNNNDLIRAPSFGLISTQPCTEPEISIFMPFKRRCFSNQKIFIKACNTNLATGALINGYVELELDSLIIPNSASISYTSLGNNFYRFDIGSLNPGQCVNFEVNTTVSCDAVLGQTLCVKANLYPADSCVFDTILTPSNGGVEPCTLPWDKSSLSVNGWCQNDSIYFAITNTGDFGNGDMQCYAPVRIYIDGVYTILDSVLLVGGQTYTYIFVGDGRTWRLEADQHPLHPGNSHPNSTVELCGNSANWTPNLVNILPMDDAESIVDIYCGEVTGSYDPNDKTGYPLGVGTDHIVTPNGKLDYVIRFQNTGTDTAFTVVVRDTLDVDLDIFSVRSGVSSHNYTFKMYGPRVMEWTFNNIMLPDSSTDQVGSNGFVTFTVLQNPDLADGTEINNRVGIYFDFNDPIITNTTSHIIGRELYTLAWTEATTIVLAVCDDATINNFTYNQTGNYIQVVDDTLYTVEVTINRNETSIYEQGCVDFSLNGQTYTESGVYSQTLTNTFNCDSVVTINLTIHQPDSIIDFVTSCDTITWLDGNTYSSNTNTPTFTLTNLAGCDSIVTLNLTINNSTFGTDVINACDSIIWIDGNTYTTNNNTPTFTLTNATGCDSIVTLNLTINNSTFGTDVINACDAITWIDGNTYTTNTNTSTFTLTNLEGCDSVITLNLTINNNDTSITQNINTLSAGETGATYQWIDCNNNNAIIIGEINQSYIPVSSGNYAVVISKNGCIDTSSCVNFIITGINDLENPYVKISPNPTTAEFLIELPNFSQKTHLSIISVEGKTVYTNNTINTNKVIVDAIDWSKGIYVLKITDEKNTQVLRLIKQ
ncbi:MAG: T9SS type A sorting domain-containing protein [Flavobacteriales bacterium]|nr:T9SS type A sorting domain-containing protein [Flavobacteriales bacterium]